MHTSTLVIPFLLSFSYGQLNDLAKAAGLKYFGSAMSFSGLSDPGYVGVASNIHDFGQVTPDNPQKWNPVELVQDVFDFSEANSITDFAETNQQMIRCHNLVWYLWLPDWVTQGQWTRDSLTAALRKHITTEVSQFKGKCYAWDVVNEAIADDGTIRESIWTDVIGDDFIQIAFETAAAADPSAKLYYNDYAIESPGPKRDGVISLVKSLQASGVKIDGVGLQSHFTAGETPSKEIQIANMEAFTALGIEVAITELDINVNLPMTAAEEQQQMDDYQSTAAACVAVQNCVGITVWGFDDKDSWLNVPGSPTGDACIFDANLNRKPAYYGVVAGLTASSKPVQQQLPPGTAASLSTSIASSSPSSPTISPTVFFPIIIGTAPTTFATSVSPTPQKTKGHHKFSKSAILPSGIFFPSISSLNQPTTGTSTGKWRFHHHNHTSNALYPTASGTVGTVTVATGNGLPTDASNPPYPTAPYPTASGTAGTATTATGNGLPADASSPPYPTSSDTTDGVTASTDNGLPPDVSDPPYTTAPYSTDPYASDSPYPPVPYPTASGTADGVTAATCKGWHHHHHNHTSTAPYPTDGVATATGMGWHHHHHNHTSTAPYPTDGVVAATGKGWPHHHDHTLNAPYPTGGVAAATCDGWHHHHTHTSSNTAYWTASGTVGFASDATGKSQHHHHHHA